MNKKQLIQEMSIALSGNVINNTEVNNAIKLLKQRFDELADEKFSDKFEFPNDVVEFNKIKKEVINKTLEELLYF